MGKKAVFFDRDGVFNKDTGYVHSMDAVQWIPGAKELVGRLTKEGWLLFVVTNQSGVARGYYTEDDVHRLHEAMNQEFAAYGGHITEFFYCPHLKGAPLPQYDVDCNCRKPKPGMVIAGLQKYGIDKSHALLIGDSPRDVEAATAAGIRGYLFNTNNLEVFWDTVVTS